MEANARGKMTPKAVGLKEDMQADVRYEFDTVLSLDKETHEVNVVKDRIGYVEIRETNENPAAPITVEDGKLLARLVAEGLSLEEIAARKRNRLISFVLDEKAHKSSKVKYFEDSKSVELSKEYLDKLSYDQLLALVKYLK
jgi:hypothetical protein